MRGYHCRQLETKTGFSSFNNNITTTAEVICHTLMMGKFLIQYFDKSLTTPRSLLPGHTTTAFNNTVKIFNPAPCFISYSDETNF